MKQTLKKLLALQEAFTSRRPKGKQQAVQNPMSDWGLLGRNRGALGDPKAVSTPPEVMRAADVSHGLLPSGLHQVTYMTYTQACVMSSHNVSCHTIYTICNQIYTMSYITCTQVHDISCTQHSPRYMRHHKCNVHPGTFHRIHKTNSGIYSTIYQYT